MITCDCLSMDSLEIDVNYQRIKSYHYLKKKEFKIVSLYANPCLLIDSICYILLNPMLNFTPLCIQFYLDFPKLYLINCNIWVIIKINLQMKNNSLWNSEMGIIEWWQIN